MSLESRIETLTAAVERLTETLERHTGTATAPAEAGTAPGKGTSSSGRRGRPKKLGELRYFVNGRVNGEGRYLVAETEKDLERAEEGGYREITREEYERPGAMATEAPERSESPESRFFHRPKTGKVIECAVGEDDARIAQLEAADEVEEIDEDRYNDLLEAEAKRRKAIEEGEKRREAEAGIDADDLDLDDDEPEVTSEELKRKLIELRDRGGQNANKAQLAEIFRKHGAKNFPELKETDYPAVYREAEKALTALGA